MALGVGLGSLIGGLSPHLSKLLGPQAGKSFGGSLGGGTGSLITSLAGSFPIGFLGGAGYGSGIRFGFEKVYDQMFKNANAPDTIKTLQGGFGIGTQFAHAQKDGQTYEQQSSTPPPSPPLGTDLTNPIQVEEDITEIEGPRLPPAGIDTSNISKNRNSIVTLRWTFQNSSGRKFNQTWKGNLDQHERRVKQLEEVAKALVSSGKDPSTSLSNILNYRKAIKSHYGVYV